MLVMVIGNYSNQCEQLISLSQKLLDIRFICWKERIGCILTLILLFYSEKLCVLFSHFKIFVGFDSQFIEQYVFNAVYFFTLLGIPRSNSIGRVSEAGTNVADNLPHSEEAIRRGEYAVIRSLIRVLEVLVQSTLYSCRVAFISTEQCSCYQLLLCLQGGVEGKRQVDKVIDRCASMQVQVYSSIFLSIMGYFQIPTFPLIIHKKLLIIIFFLA